jgi:hypothetical protein
LVEHQFVQLLCIFHSKSPFKMRQKLYAFKRICHF